MPCSVGSRRTFLQHGVCALITTSALGLSVDAEALPVAFVTAETAAAAERRYPLPATDGVSIDRSAQVILVRAAGSVYAMALACPHQQAAVKWVEKDHRFQCTKHDSRYTPDGTYTSGRATRNLDRFPLRLDGDAVVVATDHVFRSDQDQAGWRAAHAQLPGAS
jgi:nitrite reductase/ring-hydroxylating ferredoxin subunit